MESVRTFYLLFYLLLAKIQFRYIKSYGECCIPLSGLGSRWPGFS